MAETLKGTTDPLISLNSRNQIVQTERLLTARSRYNHMNESAGGDRGTRAYIRLLTDTPSRGNNTLNAGLHGLTGQTGSDMIKQQLDEATNPTQPKYGGYADFLITNVNASFDEKIQISEVFGDGEVVYYFGRAPIMFNISGVLIDSVDNQWFGAFLEMYAKVFRGTQVARNRDLIKLVLPNMELIGTIVSMNYSQTSERDTDIPFSFTFLAKKVYPMPVTQPGKVLATTYRTVNFDQVANFASQFEINSMKARTASITEAIKNPFATIGEKGALMTSMGSVMDSISGTIGTVSKGFSDAMGSIQNGINGALDFVKDVFGGISATLNGIRAQFFSPVMGVLSSLTKLVRNVSSKISEVISAFTTPIRDVLRDIQTISNQAIGLVNMVTGTVNGITKEIASVDATIARTIASVRNAAGVIMSAPKSVASSVRDLIEVGRLPASAAFLRTKGRASLGSGAVFRSKAALLPASSKRPPDVGAYL